MPEAEGLFYELHGPADAPPLILSAGLGGSGGYWQPNLDALAARHRVILYDHRGTGRSERAIGGAVTLDAMARDMRLLLDAVAPGRVTLVGHAIGGMAGMLLALADPGRIARLVVINGWARLDRHTARCFDTRLALLRGCGAQAYLHAQPLFLYPPAWISAQHDRLIAEESAQLAHFPGAAMIERRVAAALAFDVADRLGAIDVPTLLIASDDDMLVPPQCSADIQAGITGSQLMRFDTGGHACNITRADDFATRLLDWIDRA